MTEKYTLSSKMWKTLRLAEKYTGRDTHSPLTEEDINRTNRKDLPKNFRVHRIFYPETKGISCTNYVIPVTEGAVTGRYYDSANSQTRTSLKPLIVVFHGGGWVFGNIDLYDLYCKHLAKATDSAILLVDYRLAPKYKFPIAVEDCYDAYLWAVNGVKYWKVDPDRIFLLGDSCGGNLAAGVSLLCRDRKAHMPNGMILFSPLVDARLRTTSIEEYSDSPTLTLKQLRFFVESYMREQKDILSPLFSPLLSADLSRLPDTLVIAGSLDPLKDDGKLFVEAIKESGGKAHYIEIENAIHGFILHKKAKGSEESDCMVRQVISGRPIDKVQEMTESELRRENKTQMQLATAKFQKEHEERAKMQTKE